MAIKSSRVCAEDIRAITGRSPINACRGVAGTTGVGSVVESSFSGVAKSSIVFVVGSGTWNDFAMVRGENVFELVKLTADAAAQIDVVASACAILDQNALVAGETIYVDVADEALAAAIAAVAKSSSLKVAATGDKLDNVKLAITSAAGAPLTNIVRQIARNGTVVRVNAAAPSAEIGFTTGVSSFIFQDKRVRGFDLHALAEADPAACKRAVNAAAALLADKKVSLPAAKVFPQSEFAASIAAAESGKSAILTIS